MYIFRAIFIDPLHDLYMNLPYFGWGGKLNGQICAYLTGISENHWNMEGRIECKNIIQRNFESKFIIIRSFLQIYIILQLFNDLFMIFRRNILYFFFSRYTYDPVYEPRRIFHSGKMRKNI